MSSIVLQANERELVVNGRTSRVYEIVQPNGVRGLTLRKGDPFDVVVENQLKVSTGIHWHGLILPNDQDGVPFVTQPPIPPGGKYRIIFL